MRKGLQGMDKDCTGMLGVCESRKMASVSGSCTRGLKNRMALSCYITFHARRKLAIHICIYLRRYTTCLGTPSAIFTRISSYRKKVAG